MSRDWALGDLSPAIVRSEIDALRAIARDVVHEYWDEEHFLSPLPHKWALSVLARHRGRPVGYAILSEKAPGHVHLHHFMVHAAHRNGGLGTAMVAEMERRARVIGAMRITLKLHSDNAGAGRFYARHGYRPAPADSTGAYDLFAKTFDAT